MTKTNHNKKLKSCTFSFFLVLFLSISIASLVFTDTASAALLKGNKLDAQARRECQGDKEGKKKINQCTSGYKHVYEGGQEGVALCSTPIVTPGSPSNPGGGVRLGPKDPSCVAGVSLGKKAAERDGGKDESTAREVCKSNDNPGPSDRAVAACRAGYNAAKANKTIDQACRSYQDDERKEACRAGFNAKKDGKTTASLKPSTDYSDDGAGGDDDNELTDCDLQVSNPLSWILCPVIDLGANGTDWLFQNVIEPLLADIPLSLDPKDSFFQAWQGFRFIANIILVIGMLGIVYSMARGDR